MRQLTFLILIFQISGLTSEAQDLSTHQWENRILLIHTIDQTHPLYQQQISTLKSNQTGLRERKLIIYQVSNDWLRIGLDEESKWKKADESFLERVKVETNSSSGFTVQLIGLDGGIKLRKEAVLTIKELFKVIDAMPMRMQELRRKRNK